jgi:hypothetical protein
MRFSQWTINVQRQAKCTLARKGDAVFLIGYVAADLLPD